MENTKKIQQNIFILLYKNRRFENFRERICKKMHNRIYLDNGSTSWPKAPGVGDTIKNFLEQNGSNIGRGGYDEAYTTEAMIGEVRNKLANMAGDGHHPECVTFTLNVTEALNFLIKGLLSPEDHVIVSSMEHNAVMRPLVQSHTKFSRIPADQEGRMRIDAVERLITPTTKAIITTAASNVCGTIQPLARLKEIARKHHLLLIVDAAQGLPYLDMKGLEADAIAFTGHKGLLGPQGVGGMILTPQLAQAIDPLVSGGTGSMSDSEQIPPYLPDRLEAGTQNLPGILALGTALDYLEQHAEALKANEQARTQELLDGLERIPQISIIGPKAMDERVPIISIDVPGKDNADIADLLARQGIETRVGLHCAPIAHKTLGTFPRGTIRFAPGPFTTKEEIETTLQVLQHIVRA